MIPKEGFFIFFKNAKHCPIRKKNKRIRMLLLLGDKNCELWQCQDESKKNHTNLKHTKKTQNIKHTLKHKTALTKLHQLSLDLSLEGPPLILNDDADGSFYVSSRYKFGHHTRIDPMTLSQVQFASKLVQTNENNLLLKSHWIIDRPSTKADVNVKTLCVVSKECEIHLIGLPLSHPQSTERVITLKPDLGLRMGMGEEIISVAFDPVKPDRICLLTDALWLIECVGYLEGAIKVEKRIQLQMDDQHVNLEGKDVQLEVSFLSLFFW